MPPRTSPEPPAVSSPREELSLPVDTALLRELRATWGTTYSITVEQDRWCAYPSYGPSREPTEARSARELQRKLRHKQGFHIPPDENALEDRMST